jgi:tRNA threonylcarbamoyladenosine biosynthesis protein TsaE
MPQHFDIPLRSLGDTRRFAEMLARVVAPGDVVLLSGELGAGKTTLVRSMAESIGVDPRAVSSPTFTVMNAYEGGRIDPVVHMDAYRLEGEDESELLELGWDPDLRRDALTLIEWGERIADLLEDALDDEPARLTLRHAGETIRDATIRVPDDWSRRPAMDEFARLAHTLAGDDAGRAGSPFASEREQMADLYHWFEESYRVSRPIEAPDETDR